MKKYYCLLLIIAFLLPSVLFAQTKIRIYDHLMNPREHPDDTRHHVRPPDWGTFGYQTQFMALRGFELKDDMIVNYNQVIDQYTKQYDLGNILWISYPFIYGKNIAEVIDEIKQRNLYLFDLWGYVPGSGPGGYWMQYKPPAGLFEMLESKLGDHWLGFDNGEQDGRYVGGFASQMYPASAGRFEQYLNFQRHFEKMCDELGNKMSTLVSLNFGHYFLKEGVYTLIGAETAQALPNGQVYYSFIRGAGKQYGVPWFGNASVFNRWGWKAYGPEQTEGSHKSGPTKGTSLNLMKRLMYNHILYNSMSVGFESSFFDGDRLSPIGRIQQSANKWIKQIGQPGVMYTPVAVMLDFFSGWSFPRHLYSSNVYRVWGNLPYKPGDYLSDGVLDMIYPGYQNASYYHDESGFISPTPYGDFADCILSDAPAWLLDQYPLLIIGGKLSGGMEIRDKLSAYVEKGGHLIITAGSLAKLPGGLAGIKVTGTSKRFKPSDALQCGQDNINENVSFELSPLVIPSGAEIITKCGDSPAVVEISYGKGKITVCASPFGVGAESAINEPVTSKVDKPLLKPYPLLKHIRVVFDQAFRSQMVFEVNENLSLITCRKAPGLYLVEICNNLLKQEPFQIISHCGSIESIRELELDQSEKQAVGYLPDGFEKATIGVSDEWNIAGGDTRIFMVRVQEEGIESIPHIVPSPRPQKRALTLRGITSIKEEILARPTFFEHFDRIVIDWKYIRQREKDILKQEIGWINRQKLGVIVDLTSGINLYPNLRLTNNLEEDYLSSMAAIKDVVEKMEIIGAHDLILTLHRGIENNFTRAQTQASFDSTLRVVCKIAAGHKVTVNVRMAFSKPPQSLSDAVKFIERVGEPNLRLAPSTALLLSREFNLKETAAVLKDKVGLWIVSTPEFDIAGRLWNANAPIAKFNENGAIADIISIAQTVPIILDGVYKNQDEEYLDVCALKQLAPPIIGE